MGLTAPTTALIAIVGEPVERGGEPTEPTGPGEGPLKPEEPTEPVSPEEKEQIQQAISSDNPQAIGQIAPDALRSVLEENLADQAQLEQVLKVLSSETVTQLDPSQIQAIGEAITEVGALYEKGAKLSTEVQMRLVRLFTDSMKLALKLPGVVVGNALAYLAVGTYYIAYEDMKGTGQLEALRRTISTVVMDAIETKTGIRIMAGLIERVNQTFEMAFNKQNTALANSMAWMHTALLRSLPDDVIVELASDPEKLKSTRTILEYALKNKIQGATDTLNLLISGLSNAIATKGQAARDAFGSTLSWAFNRSAEQIQPDQKLPLRNVYSFFLPRGADADAIEIMIDGNEKLEKAIPKDEREQAAEGIAAILSRFPRLVSKSPHSITEEDFRIFDLFVEAQYERRKVELISWGKEEGVTPEIERKYLAELDQARQEMLRMRNEAFSTIKRLRGWK